jgi:hypothetical protein
MQLSRTQIGFSLLFACISLFSCKKEDYESYNGSGKRPIYIPLAELKNIGNLPPQPIEASGTIFLRDTMFFMLESGKGIHVFNIKDSLNSKKLTFWKIPAITDFYVSTKLLYAAAWKDLVVVDIENIYEIKALSRNEGAFDPILYPPLHNGRFECVDESKGAIIGWETAFIKDALCNTVN